MLDYHLHLWRHGEEPSGVTVERIAAYWRHAEAAGVREIAVTEHLFRFRQADAALAGFWDDDPNPALRSAMGAAWASEGRIDLDHYVEVALEARSAGLPVVLGMEVDHYPGRMDAVASLLEPYPFDVLLGAVHWLGAWGFDEPEVPAFSQEWSRRGAEQAWDGYVGAIEEIAASGAVDVLAHPDYIKSCGPTPVALEEFHERIADATAAGGLAAEVSSAAWHEVDEPYPAPTLLDRLHRLGVPVTTASDAHDEPDVAYRVDDLRAILLAAGYEELTGFRRRRPHPVRIGGELIASLGEEGGADDRPR
jgi:histidinol-phosphatase (PHP family)